MKLTWIIRGIAYVLCLPLSAHAQSWTTPWTATTGVLVSAAQLNQTRDNLNVLRTGGIAITSQNVNEIIYASSATQLTRSSNWTYNGTGLVSLSNGLVGSVAIAVRNTTAGTANYSRVQVGNDTTAALLVLDAFSSTYTPTGDEFAAAGRVAATQAGGLSLSATHASGAIRLAAGGTTSVLSMTGTTITASQEMNGIDGSLAVATYGFTTSPSTGMYYTAGGGGRAAGAAFTANGTAVITLSGTIVEPLTSGIDLGSATYTFRDVYVRDVYATTVNATSLVGAGLALAALTPTTNGTLIYCTDCAHSSNPCTGSSTGSFAKRLNGVWVCT